MRARRLRKMWGGGMRQAGILAAGARFGLDHHFQSLHIDHARATRLAQAARAAGFACVAPETNIVMLPTRRSASELATQAAAMGLALSVFGPQTLRLVTHRDLDDEGEHAATELLERLARLDTAP
jgi:threonine aldolase